MTFELPNPTGARMDESYDERMLREYLNQAPFIINARRKIFAHNAQHLS
jgi:hypothetical protein